MDLEEAFAVTMLQKIPMKLAPGQSRPLTFSLSVQGPVPKAKPLKILYSENVSPTHLSSIGFSLKFSAKGIHEPHRITFLHPAGIVSYAILRAPSAHVCAAGSEESLPILLNLHGAGLEADCYQVRHTLEYVFSGFLLCLSNQGHEPRNMLRDFTPETSAIAPGRILMNYC